MQTDIQSIFRWCILLSAVAAVCAFGSGIGMSQTSPPNAYYGVAESSLRVAPEGTTIVAVANGNIQDTITVGENGQYGSSDPAGEKLRVDASVDTTVTFHVGDVDGPVAEETDTNPTSEVEELDLTFPDGTFGSTSTTPTETETSTTTETETSTTTETETSTTTETETSTTTETETSTTTETATQQTSEDTTVDESDDESDGGAQDQTESSSESRVATEDSSGENQQSSMVQSPIESPRNESVAVADDLTITNITLNRTTVSQDEVIRINATVTNTGNDSVTERIPLLIGDNQTAIVSVTVNPGASEQITYTYRATRPGEYTVTVGDVQDGTVTVSGSGWVPWSIFQAIFMYILLPIGIIYGILKALAIYYGY